MDNAEKINDTDTGLAQHSLRGEIRKVIYESDEGAYSVIRIVDAKGVEHTLVGNISGAHSGEHIEASGRWEKHPEFGRQLRVEHYSFVLPASSEGIERYLASGIIPGIGPKLAKCIVDHFGDKTLDILDNYSSRLKEIPGVGKKRIEIVRKAWHEQKSRSEIFVFMQGLGISSTYCQKIYNLYGDDAPNIIQQDPYRLADDVKGIGFIMADRIAASMGISKNSNVRLAAGVLYAIGQLVQAGHCCYPESEFISYAAQILDADVDAVRKGIDAAVAKRRLIVEKNAPGVDNMIYSTPLFAAENELPGLLCRLASVNNHKGARILSVPPPRGLSLTAEQLSAVERVGHNPLSIITGGPGVGKTTVVGEIVRRAFAAKLKVYLAAPTGRAAKRLAESARHQAATIHRLLKWDPGTKAFVYGRERQLGCDLLILDEVSMLDISLAVFLFRAIRQGTTVVLVGDADQLPSVGPGRVLDNFIASGLFACTHLSQVFRQGAGSSIITNAHNVNRGLMPDLTSGSKRQPSDFYWIEQEDPETVLDLIVRMQCKRIPKRFGFDPVRDIQILTPMNRGVCGAINLNNTLQQIINPGNKPQFKFGERVFKAGDKVMQIANNYDKNVFNGDMGRIGQIDHHGRTFKVFFESQAVDYEYVDAEQLNLAYAITVHKSQGSEFPVVIVPVLTQHYMMLQRNLIYTAMTRARKLLIFIGSRKAVSMAVSNASVQPRYTLLLERIKSVMAGNGRRML